MGGGGKDPQSELIGPSLLPCVVSATSSTLTGHWVLRKASYHTVIAVL